MSATQTTVPAEEGEADAGTVKSSAPPDLPQGGADTDSSDASAVGAQASEEVPDVLVDVPDDATPYRDAYEWTTVKVTVETPRWSAVDDERGNLLDLLANEHPEIPSKAEEWEHFRKVLADVAAENGGVIDQNLTRPRLAGAVAPQRVGPMFRRACREGLIRPNSDHTITANSQSGNVGRPARSYDWLGTRGGEPHER